MGRISSLKNFLFFTRRVNPSGYTAMPIIWAGVAFCIVAAILLSAASAKEIELTEISLQELMDLRIQPVVSASKYEQKTIEAPSSMTVVTAEQIQKNGYRTLADILRGVRGFYIRDDRNYEYVGFRGINRPGDYSTRVLMLVDGINVNDNIYTSAPIGRDFLIDVDLISRVEIVRGPSYTLYGNNAFFAVINVITKNAQDINGAEASGSVGRFESYEGRFSYGKSFKENSQLLISGTSFDSDGPSTLYFPEFDTPDQHNGVAEDLDGEDAKSLLAKYSKDSITITGAYVKRGKQIPTAPWGTLFNDPRIKAWDERAFFDVKMDRELSDNIDLTARTTFGHYDYDGRYAYWDEDSQSAYLNKDDQKGQWWGIDCQLVNTIGTHKVITGFEYRDNFTLKQKNYDVLGDIYLDDNRDTSNWGIFIQDEFPLIANLKINAGLRYDHFSTFGGSLNPRFGLIYRPLPDTAIKYLAGKAFRSPNSYELFYNDGGISQRSSPNLKEESLISHELVWEQLIGRYFSSSVTLYHYSIEKLISQAIDNDGLLIFVNQDDVEAKGIEVGGNAFFQNGLRVGLSYTLQDSDYKRSDKPWVNSPRHLAKINLSVPIMANQMFLTFEEHYVGELLTLSGAATGDYFVTNLTFFWKNVLDQTDLSASIYNLFDCEYGIPGSSEHIEDVIRQNGINFRVKLTVRFF